MRKASIHPSSVLPMGQRAQRTGQHSKRSALLPPKEKRLKTSGWREVKKGFSRIATVLTPPGVRTDAQVRHDSRKTHEALKALLACMRTPGLPPAALIAQHLDTFTRASKALGGSGPVSQTQVLNDALAMHLPQLSIDTLKNLRSNALNALELPGLNAGARQQLQALADQTRADCAERLREDLITGRAVHVPSATGTVDQILEALDKAVRQQALGPQAVEHHLDAAISWATDLLRRYGLIDSDMDDGTQGLAFLKELMALCSQSGRMNQHELLQMFQAMPAPRLAQMLAAHKRRLPVDEVPVDHLQPLLQEAIQAQWSSSVLALDKACKDLLRTDKLPRQVQHLGSVARHWVALKDQAQAHQRSVEHLLPQLERVMVKALKEINPSAERLQMLNDADLSALHEALKAMDIDRFQAPIEAEIAARKNAAVLAHNKDFSKALDALSKGKLEQALRHLRSAHVRLQYAKEVHAALGEPLKGPEGTAVLFERLLDRLFADASPDECLKWFKALDQKQLQLLGHVLVAVDGGEAATNARLQQIGINLLDTHRQLSQRLNKPSEHVLGPVQQRHAADLLDLPTQQTAHAFTKGLVRPTDLTFAGRQAPLDDTAQQAMTALLDVLSKEPPQPAHPRLLDAAIDTDMQHTDYRVLREGQADEAFTGGRALRMAVPLTPQQHWRLARLAGIDIWKNTADAALVNAERTPIRAADGSTLRLEGELAHTTCRITPGLDGQLTLRFDRTLTGPLRAVNMNTGERVLLDPQQSMAYLSVSFTLHPDGTLTPAEPLSCDACIEPASHLDPRLDEAIPETTA